MPDAESRAAMLVKLDRMLVGDTTMTGGMAVKVVDTYVKWTRIRKVRAQNRKETWPQTYRLLGMDELLKKIGMTDESMKDFRKLARRVAAYQLSTEEYKHDSGD